MGDTRVLYVYFDGERKQQWQQLFYAHHMSKYLREDDKGLEDNKVIIKGVAIMSQTLSHMITTNALEACVNAQQAVAGIESGKSLVTCWNEVEGELYRYSKDSLEFANLEKLEELAKPKNGSLVNTSDFTGLGRLSFSYNGNKVLDVLLVCNDKILNGDKDQLARTMSRFTVDSDTTDTPVGWFTMPKKGHYYSISLIQNLDRLPTAAMEEVYYLSEDKTTDIKKQIYTAVKKYDTTTYENSYEKIYFDLFSEFAEDFGEGWSYGSRKRVAGENGYSPIINIKSKQGFKDCTWGDYYSEYGIKPMYILNNFFLDSLNNNLSVVTTKAELDNSQNPLTVLVTEDEKDNHYHYINPAYCPTFTEGESSYFSAFYYNFPNEFCYVIKRAIMDIIKLPTPTPTI